MKSLKHIFILFIFGVLITFISCSPRHKSSKTTSSQSAPTGFTSESAFLCKIKVLDNEDKIKVLILAELKRGYETMSVEAFINRFAGTYVLLPDYNKKEFLATGSIFLTKETISTVSPNVFSIAIDINKPNASTVLLKLEISDLETKQKSGDELIVRLKAEKLSDSFAFFDSKTNLPLMTSFTSEGKSVILKDIISTKKNFKAYHYNNNFDAAPSPMAVGSHSNISQALPSDSNFIISSNNSIEFHKKGLYFITEISDSSKANGLYLFVTDKRFPRLTKAEDLLKPIIYISSGEEINEVKKSQEAKKTLDRYWIRLSNGNEDAAKQTIKLYYRRVMLANQLFTTYKDGWKTDFGMVYTVFGPPDKINKLKDRQIWTYTQNSNFSEINFTFIKRKNLFTENEFELQRYNEYEPIWYPVVDGWRTGSIY